MLYVKHNETETERYRLAVSCEGGRAGLPISKLAHAMNTLPWSDQALGDKQGNKGTYIPNTARTKKPRCLSPPCSCLSIYARPSFPLDQRPTGAFTNILERSRFPSFCRGHQKDKALVKLRCLDDSLKRPISEWFSHLQYPILAYSQGFFRVPCLICSFPFPNSSGVSVRKG